MEGFIMTVRYATHFTSVDDRCDSELAAPKFTTFEIANRLNLYQTACCRKNS